MYKPIYLYMVINEPHIKNSTRLIQIHRLKVHPTLTSLAAASTISTSFFYHIYLHRIFDGTDLFFTASNFNLPPSLLL